MIFNAWPAHPRACDDTCSEVTDHIEQGSWLGYIGAEHRITVHCRVPEGRDTLSGDHIRGEHSAGRIPD